jgi:oligosaccharide repeat unit polymerase
MLSLVFVLLVAMLYASRRRKGPLWALGIAWLVCLAPIASNAFSYAYLSQSDVGFGLLLLAYLGCFVLGVLAHDDIRHRREPLQRNDASVEMRRAAPWAQAAWWAGAIGTLCLCIDFALLQGAGLDDLAALRDAVIAREATLLGRLASVLTWGCLYCFAYALMYREVLPRRRFLFYLLPIFGYFLVALFSAGRQAALQILIFALLTLALKRVHQPAQRAARRSSLVLGLAISLIMVAYMGYVASARNDAALSEDKTEVLISLFDFGMAPWLESIFSATGTLLRAAIVEGAVYFSSSITLFSVFLHLDITEHSFGAMSLPFVFRQLEPLTGISVIGALENKIQMMAGAGVIGVGWTTAISSYILDFGAAGAAVVLFLQGYYSAFAWRRARKGTDFQDAVIALIMLTAAIYMPLIAASGETNLLLLWGFCLFARSRLHRRRSRSPRRARRAGRTPGAGQPAAAPLALPRA